MSDSLLKFDCQKLLGHKLELVCFAEYSFYLHFDGGLRISVESMYDVRKTGQPPPYAWHRFPVTESTLPSLVGCHVAQAAVAEDEIIHLAFSNGSHLFIKLTSGYESVSISCDGVETIY